MEYIGKFDKLKNYGFINYGNDTWGHKCYIRYHNKSKTIFTIIKMITTRRKKGAYKIEMFTKKDLLPKTNMQKYVNNMDLERPNKWKYYTDKQCYNYNEDLIKDGYVDVN